MLICMKSNVIHIEIMHGMSEESVFSFKLFVFTCGMPKLSLLDIESNFVVTQSKTTSEIKCSLVCLTLAAVVG